MTAPACWVHGDLYARHLLADEVKNLVGVIDWGDLHLGDAALDLSIAWSFLHAEARTEFAAAYGVIGEASWNRARFRALNYGIILMLYGRDINDPHLRSVGEYALLQAAGPDRSDPD